ncbi:putative protease m14 carboxypeptidase [Schistosoma mansoni]|nr:putative protease m14 carboxypeptidase [Schistosoma mansoni]|eukprot:XP_018652452.1 putative protease m14 carboxypeptidase [Schistosoma mansoni]
MAKFFNYLTTTIEFMSG